MNGQRIKSVVLAIVLWVALSILASACGPAAPPAPTATPSPVDLVKAYEDAFNRHDMEGVMGLLSENIKFHMSSYYSSNRDTMQSLLKEVYFGFNSEIRHIDCTTSEYSVTCKSVFNADWVKAAEVNEQHFGKAVFTFHENKIGGIEYGLENADERAKFDNFFISFFEWFEKKYPDEYEKYANDHLLPGFGQTVNMRIQEYAASLK